MATNGGDVTFKFGGDTSGLVAAVRDVAAQQEAAASAATKAAAAAAAALEQERAATVKVSDAERELVKAMQATDAAAKAKASVLGITVTQLKAVEAAEQKAAAAAAASATAAGGSAGQYDKLSGAVGKATQVSGALGGVISRVDPQMGAAVSSVGTLAGAFQGLTGAGVLTTAMLGPLAIAVAALAGAYYVLSTDLKEAEAAQKKYAETAEEAQKASEGWKGVLDGIDAQWQLTTGKITPSAAKAKEEIGKLNAAFQTEAAEIKKTAANTADADAKIAGLTSRYADALTKIRETETAEGKKGKATKESTSATRDATDATREYEAAQKAIQAAMTEDSRLNGQAESAIAALQKMESAATKSTLSGVDAEIAARKEAEAAALTQYQAGVEAASGQADKLTELATQYEATRVALAKSSQKKIDGIHEEEADKAAKLASESAAKQAAIERATNDSIMSLAGSTHDALMLYAEKQSKKNKEAARIAFFAAQAVAAGQAVISAALAVSNALATVPYPAAPFVAAAAAAVGAVQVATILSEKPSFHSGGMLYPDEGNATLLRGEPVINRQAASRMGLDNPAAVADVNHGGAGAPTLGGVTMLRIGRLEAREIVRSDVVSGGLIVRTARQAAASSGNPAGRTGRRPIA